MNNYFIFSLFTKYSEEGARGAAWIARRPSNSSGESRRSGVQIPAGPPLQSYTLCLFWRYVRNFRRNYLQKRVVWIIYALPVLAEKIAMLS